ncbi:alpha/beta hydrolase [Xylanimonas sp. McL0601]|uniref:alpha/beta hydrolase n=1 Tax=Xylanimonas sp. McL0601 TaxID=3414739 RepID=UPI003CFA579E
MVHVGPPAPVRPADRAATAPARRGLLPFGDGHVVTYRWGGDDAPVVLLAHGWQLRASRLAALTGDLAHAGFQVVAFDAPAHGDSPGRRTHVLQFAEILHLLADDVAARGGNVAGVVGHSLGGLAAGIAVREGLGTPRWATIGAPSSVESVGQAFARLAGLPRELVPRLNQAAAARFFAGIPDAWERGDLVARPAPSDVAALFVQDVDDRLLEPGDARRLHAAHPGSELLTTGGLGHNRVLDDLDVRAAVVQHVTAALLPA